MIKNYNIILINAKSEWKAIKLFFSGVGIQNSPFGEYFINDRCLYFYTACGKSNAAAATQYIIDHWEPKYIINIGTCGGFLSQTEVGNVILVTETLMYDVLEEEGAVSETFDSYRSKLDLTAFNTVDIPVDHRGLMISADRDVLPEEVPGLIKKYAAMAADWESASIAHIAKLNRVPVLILRGVSDLISEQNAEMYGDADLYEMRVEDVMKKLMKIIQENKI